MKKRYFVLPSGLTFVWIYLAFAIATSPIFSRAAESQLLRGHVPAVTARLHPSGSLETAKRLSLAMGLPLRNQAALEALLRDINDPTSPDYHHYLTPEQFNEEFGPTESDYEAVKAFAKASGFQVTATYPNRLLLDVNGSVGDIERAFHLTINVYSHPTENRTFYAPSVEPSINLSVPLLHVSGLDNYALPRPRLVSLNSVNDQSGSPNAGSGPGGTYRGKDFRAAYVPDSSLNGSGQTLGLFEYDGYNSSDIAYYENAAGLPKVTLQNVLIDGATGQADGSSADVEVALDIEMAISMATNLSQVTVYEAPGGSPFEDLLNRMATDYQTKQFSCSWYFPGGTEEPTADEIWQQMAAQGQSFFNASGDNDAYTGLIPFPGDTPYVTQVGGTTLTTSGPGGAWVAETVWNWGTELGAFYNGVGSSGGISTQYPVPAWQTNISMAANHGSTSRRNTPDVAMAADNIYVRADAYDYKVGGTSCAAPLWAGFAALVNQQAAASGKPSIGLVNSAVDTIGSGRSYGLAFHDITTGNNTWSGSPSRFAAVPGYDLCTGWGTPAGQNLIDALANPEPLVVTPGAGFISTGGVGGPFTVVSQMLSLTNAGTNNLSWTLSNTSLWLNVSSDHGTLSPGGLAQTVTASLNSAASNLIVGTYVATLWFTNANDGFGQSRQFTLNVISPPTITLPPAAQAVLEGATASFKVNAIGGSPLSYQWQFKGTNLSDGPDISGSATTNLSVSDVLPADVGNYAVVVTNLAGVAHSDDAALTITPSAPVIVVAPANQSAVVGDTATFNVGVIGTLPYAFQWTYNGADIDGATNSSLTLTDVQTSEAGNYAVVVTNTLGSTSSSPATLAVYAAPFSLFFDDFSGPTLNPVWQTNLPNAYCGSFPTLGSGPQIANYIGAPAYSFESLDTNSVLRMTDTMGPLQRRGWSSSTNFFANGFRYEARFNSLVQSSTTSIDGFFEIWVMNATNENLYDIVSPFSGGFGSSFYAFFGSSIDNSFLTAPYTYTSNTWYRLVIQCLPGQNIRESLCDDSGTELTGYTLAHDATAFGAGFKIVISQAVGASVIAYPTDGAVDYVKLTSGFAPAITAQPQSQAVAAGSNVTFSVAAAGTVPFFYQWNYDGTNISGATNTTLTLTDVQVGEAGSYSVVVTNAYGMATSSNALLAIGLAPSIATQPMNQTVAEGGTAGFSVTAGGSGPLSYQWNFDGNPIAGATNDVLTLTNVPLAEAGSYSMLVTNIFGSIISSGAVLTVTAPPVVSTQPVSQTVSTGGTATFAVVAAGTTPLSYQWSFDGTSIAGATSATLTLADVQPSEAGNYAVMVTNAYGSVTSSNAVLTVTAPPAGATFFDDFNGPTLNPIWQTNLPNAYCGSFLVGSAQIADYLGAPDYSFQSSSSNSVLRMTDTMGPLQRRGWSSSTNFFANGFRYEARFNSLVQSTTTSIDGFFEIWIMNATNENLYDIVSPFSGDFGNSFYAFFGSSVDNYYSSTPYNYTSNTWYRLVIQCLPGQNIRESLCDDSGTELAGYTLAHGAAAFGSGFKIVISQAVGASYTPYPTDVAVDYVSLTSGFAPAITAQPQGQTAVEGADVSFGVTADGTSPLSYQWVFDGSNIAGATNTTLTLTDVQPSQAGNYAVVITNAYGSVTSSNAVLAVNASLTGASFFDDFNGPTLNPIWQTNLPNAYCGSFSADSAQIADYLGAPDYSFQSSSSNSVLRMTDTMGPLQRRGWSSSTNFFANGFRYEARFNSLVQSSTTSIDGFFEIWIMNATNENLYDIVSPFSGDFGNSFYAFFGSSVDNYYSSTPYNYTSNTWYRLVIQCLPGQNIRESLCDDSGTELAGYTLAHGAAAFGSGFKIVISQAVGASYTPYPTDVAVDYVSLNSGLLPQINVQPQSQTVVENSNVTFSVTANGYGPLAYQWSFDGTNISGATNTTLTLTGIQPDETGNYSVAITNAYGSVTSSNALLTVNSSATSISFFDDFNGPTLNPIWQANLPNAYCGSFSADSAQIANYLGAPDYGFQSLDSNSVLRMTDTMGPLQRRGWSSSTNFFANGFRYEARFNSLVQSSTTSIDGFFEIWIMNATNENLYDIVSPFSGDFGNSFYAFFGSSVDNYYSSTPYNYTSNTWYRLVIQCLPGQNIRESLCDDSGTELAGYTLAHGAAAFGSGFKIVISQAVGASYTPYPTDVAVDYVSLNSGLLPQINVQPQSQTVVENSNVTFSVTANGYGPLAYQWSFDGTNISGATNTTLTLTGIQPDETGNYSVAITNAYGSVTSSNALLTFVALPTITVQPTNLTVSAASTAMFSIVAGGGAPLSYQWIFNGTNLISGATNPVLTLSGVQFTNAGDYSVTITSPYGSVTSSNALLVVTVDHFAWATIPSPRYLNTSFPVQITAEDAVGGVFTNYTGVVHLSLTNGTSVSPAVSGNFVQGLWTGGVKILQTGSNLVLNANDGAGHIGLANPIAVANLPVLATIPSGSTIYIFWPSSSSGFVLETTSNLASGIWTPVTAPPVQVGDQYLEPITLTGTNAFYRLEFIGQ